MLREYVSEYVNFVPRFKHYFYSYSLFACSTNCFLVFQLPINYYSALILIDQMLDQKFVFVLSFVVVQLHLHQILLCFCYVHEYIHCCSDVSENKNSNCFVDSSTPDNHYYNHNCSHNYDHMY